MLVLTVKPGEKIRIGDDIVVSVVRPGLHSVRIGIDSPKHVKILRENAPDKNAAEPAAEPGGAK